MLFFFSLFDKVNVGFLYRIMNFLLYFFIECRYENNEGVTFEKLFKLKAIMLIIIFFLCVLYSNSCCYILLFYLFVCCVIGLAFKESFSNFSFFSLLFRFLYLLMVLIKGEQMTFMFQSNNE